MAVGSKLHTPAAWRPGMTQYPLCRRLCGSQGRPGRLRKNHRPYWDLMILAINTEHTGRCRLQLKCDGTRRRKGGGKWGGNLRMEWVASTLHTTSEHGVSSITTADAHNLAASSRLNWRPRRFKWTRPFRRKTKSGFCACAITFQLASATPIILYRVHAAATWKISYPFTK
jgi:hypothetical protein